ncbi:MAG TPA: CHRD domain-containing protein, partial [Thermoanaerobaculia bacterium]|nr:CHRD domain-containing protein [Thermoanaerobaculia bacterium]
MKHPVVPGFLLVLLALPLFAQTTTFQAVLTGSQEAPTPNTSTAYGFATIVIDSTRTQLTANVKVTGLTTPVTGAHIHKEAAGVAGPVVVSFNAPASLSGNRITGTFTIASGLADDIIANPQNYYVNVHTTQYPGGEIRGQLASTSGIVTFAGELLGSNEVPAVTTNAIGAYFMTLDAQNNLTWEINVRSLANPTLAHIHLGEKGVTGSPIITLANSSSAFVNGRLSGTTSIAGLTAAQLAAIRANPGVFYVNVHSTAHPGGELRGQLAYANEYDIPVAGKVTNNFGQNFVTDVRIFNPSFDTSATVLLEFFPVGTSSPTAATSLAFQIKPRGTGIIDDVNGISFLNASGTGALRISSGSKLVVTSRIYNDQRSAGLGTYGQFVPSVRRDAMATRGVLPQLSNRTVDFTSGSRTNIGFFNPNPSAATVRLELSNQDAPIA